MKRHITIMFPITVLCTLPCVLHAPANSSSVMWSQYSILWRASIGKPLVMEH